MLPHQSLPWVTVDLCSAHSVFVGFLHLAGGRVFYSLETFLHVHVSVCCVVLLMLLFGGLGHVLDWVGYTFCWVPWRSLFDC